MFRSVPELDSLALTVLPDNIHEYILTNRKNMHWTSETNKLESRKWHGLVINRWTTITNFWLDTSSVTTDKDIVQTSIYPHKVETTFLKEEGHVIESIFLVRDQNLMIIQYRSDFSAKVQFRLQVGMRRDWEAEAHKPTPSYDVENGIFFLSMDPSSYRGPQYLGISLFPKTTISNKMKRLGRTYSKDHFRGDGHDDEFIFEFNSNSFSLTKDEPVTLFIGFAESTQEIYNLFKRKQTLELWNSTVNPLKLLLKANNINLANTRWKKALNWAILSLDSLSMDVKGKGIYAGLHWFPEYWCRDSFISFRGALVSSGNSSMAREWIRTMAKSQDKNVDSQTYGRVPNIIQVDNPYPNYETADGTGWFIRAIWDFFQTYGLNSTFLQEIWSALVIALQGEISRTDTKGFVTHEPRASWMDAQTDGIIATPRANRAVEVQVLFYVALDIGSRLALIMNEKEHSKNWKDRMVSLKQNFLSEFWNPKDNSLYDHLNEDNSPNKQKRPNEIFAVTLPLPDNPLLNSKQELLVLEDVIHHCLAPQGVRSLSPDDPNYHPLHDHGTRKGPDHHDFSYHNGDVWLWLSGPVIESSLKYGQIDIANHLTSVLTERILTRGALGTLAEIMDGTDEDLLGNSRGTISQAWSLAEYLRTFSSGWMGVTTNAIHRILTLTPILNGDLLGSQFTFSQNEGNITISYQKLGTKHISIHCTMIGFNKPITLQLQLYCHQIDNTPFLYDETTPIPFERHKNYFFLQIDDYFFLERILTIKMK